jgi:hypothetical protein
MPVTTIYRLGMLACILLVVSCFMPWAYYPDLQTNFTGFYSHKNFYGKPGKFLTLLSLLSLVCMLVPRLWAKRAHLFIAALMVGYAIKSYILFTSCYNALCPEKRVGIFLMLFSTLAVLLSSFLPANGKAVQKEKEPVSRQI